MEGEGKTFPNMNLGNGKYQALVQSLYLLRLKKARLLR